MKRLFSKGFRNITSSTGKSTSQYDHDDSISINIMIPENQAVELGTINYVNLTPDKRHGDLSTALKIATQTKKPIFANFVEWSG